MEAPEIKTVPAQDVIAMSHRGSYDEIGAVYHALRTWARARGVRVSGPGLTTFLAQPTEFNPLTGSYEVCLPVEGAVEGDASVSVKRLPATTVAAVRVKGPYEGIAARYSEMLAWLTAENREIAGPPREVYLKRPDAEGRGNPDEYLTEIQFPIRA